MKTIRTNLLKALLPLLLVLLACDVPSEEVEMGLPILKDAVSMPDSLPIADTAASVPVGLTGPYCSYSGVRLPSSAIVANPVSYHQLREAIQPFYEALAGKFVIKEVYGVKGAFADFADNGYRRILYNPDFFDAITERTKMKWAAVSVLGHELGHHVMTHQYVPESLHDEEIEADRWSGLFMRLLNLSESEATAVMDHMGPELSHPSYPDTAKRRKAIQKGYAQAKVLQSIPSIKEGSALMSAHLKSGRHFNTFIAPAQQDDLLYLIRDGFLKTKILVDQFENLEQFEQKVLKKQLNIQLK